MNLEHEIDAYVRTWGHSWPAFRFHGEIAVSVRGEVRVAQSHGFRDLAEQVAHEGASSFRLGTLSAHLTAAAALALADEGALELGAPVADYVDGAPKAIAVEHLLTYTSGLPSFTQDLAFGHLKHRALSHDTIVQGFLRDPLEFEPGSDFAPSNSNAAMLGLVIERAAGLPYDEVVRTRVLEPLQLEHTTWGEAEDNAVGLVFNEQEHLDVSARVDPRAFGGAGGWSSTTADLHRFYAGVLGGQFGGERSRLRWLGDNAYGRPYALVELSIDSKPAYVWLGRIDGFNSAALVVPSDELVVTVLANSEVLPAEQLATDVAQLAYGVPVAEREEPRAVPVDPAVLARLSADWTITRKTETMLLDAVSPETFDKLRHVQTRWDENTSSLSLLIPDHGRKRMHPLGNGRFFFKDAPQSTATYVASKGVLVLQRDGTELRYVMNP